MTRIDNSSTNSPADHRIVNISLRAHAARIPLLHRRLKTTGTRNLLNTKRGPNCGDGGDEAWQTQGDTLDYNRNYRLSDRCQRRVRKALPRIFPPLALLNHRLKIIWRKNLRGIKRAGDFAAACWRSGKKVLLHALARIGPALYNLLKSAWSPAIAGLLSATRENHCRIGWLSWPIGISLA